MRVTAVTHRAAVAGGLLVTALLLAMALGRQHPGRVASYLERLSEDQRAELRAYAKAQADAAPPITAEQWTALHQLLWPDAQPVPDAHAAH